MKVTEFYFMELQDDGSEICIDSMTPSRWPDELEHRSDAFWERYARKIAARIRKETGTHVRAIKFEYGEEKKTLH
jgi:hypothetical protein